MCCREFWRGRLDSSGRSSPRPNVTSPGLEGRRSLPPVNFKDLNLSVDDELDSEDQEGGSHAYVDEDPTNKSAIIRTKSIGRAGAVKNKLIIIMVGLPGRGKTFLCNKLKCYLNWWVETVLAMAYTADPLAGCSRGVVRMPWNAPYHRLCTAVMEPRGSSSCRCQPGLVLVAAAAAAAS